MEEARDIWLAIFDGFVAGLGWWHLLWVVPIVIGSILFGWRYRQRITALEARHPVTIQQNILGGRASRSDPLVDPMAHPKSLSSPEEGFRALESQIEAFASGRRNDHAGIWELHFSLGELGIPWPGPGIEPKFRRRVSALILEACRDSNMETARSAWAKAREENDAPA